MLRNIQYDQMNIVETILTPILANISEIDKWQRDFLVELFTTLFSRQGRFNFENLTRYSKYNELTHRRQFSKYLDWFSLNKSFIDFNSSVHIGVIDCSFISKSGKKTFGLDKFYPMKSSVNKLKIFLIFSTFYPKQKSNKIEWSNQKMINSPSSKEST